MQLSGREGLGINTSIVFMGCSQPSRLAPERAPRVGEDLHIAERFLEGSDKTNVLEQYSLRVVLSYRCLRLFSCQQRQGLQHWLRTHPMQTVYGISWPITCAQRPSGLDPSLLRW